MTTPVQNRSEAVRSEIVEQDHDPNIEGSSSYQIFKRLLSPFMNMGHNMVDSLEVKLDPIVPVKNRVHLKKVIDASHESINHSEECSVPASASMYDWVVSWIPMKKD